MLALAAPVGRLSGVGPALARELAKAGIERVADLLWLLPEGWDDLAHAASVSAAVARAPERPRLAVRGVVRSAGSVFLRGRRATRVVLADAETASKLTLWWFFAARGIAERAQPGRELVAVGRVSPERRGTGALMAHPDLLDPAALPPIRPRYPRAGASRERLRQLVAKALATAERLPDPVPEEVARREGFEPLPELLNKLHAPETLPSAAEARAAREQLAWAEAFARVLGRQLRQEAAGERPSAPVPPAPEAIARLGRELGFAFTAAQARAIAEIGADLAGAAPMRRLLLGDVGSGKTAVALAALAQVVAAGRQGVVFAPTGVLAHQYRAAAAALERAFDCRVELVTAELGAAARRKLERDLASGAIAVVVGTHALLDEALAFADLALAVVDEQQRFGVAQRLAIADKAAHTPHLLSLSATPIPRTLALALRGEIAVSELGELPPGRQPIATELVPRSAWTERVEPALRQAAARGEGSFVVCPAIGDDADEPGAVQRHAELAALLPDRVVLAHGRLPPARLSAAIEAFRSGRADVLVGTTVVEVGIDVPRASVMVIDGAERFGLAQLHQLRGRVGRGERASRCLLVHDEPLTELARARLGALLELTRGADIARRDLELRGAGDLDGTRQAGDSGLWFLDAFADAPWLGRIASDVERIRAADPRLEQHPDLALFAVRVLSRTALREEAA